MGGLVTPPSNSLSAVLLVSFDVLLAAGLLGRITVTYIDDISWGTCSTVNVILFLLSITFPAAAAASLWAVYRARKATINRLVYHYLALCLIAMAIVAVYYSYWGFLGLRLWA